MAPPPRQINGQGRGVEPGEQSVPAPRPVIAPVDEDDAHGRGGCTHRSGRPTRGHAHPLALAGMVPKLYEAMSSLPDGPLAPSFTIWAWLIMMFSESFL